MKYNKPEKKQKSWKDYIENDMPKFWKLFKKLPN